MIELIVPTNKQKLAINMDLHFYAPCDVRAIGYDKSYPDTQYFNRLIVPNGNYFNVDFTLPVSPRKLVITFANETHQDDNMYQITAMDIDALNNKGVDLTAYDYNNIKWLIDFAKEASYKINGIYDGPNKDIWINYMPEIIDEQDGKIPTPARVDHATGEMQVNSQLFRSFTVPIRAMILCHEYSHWRWDNTDETFCDLEACRICLGLGFPKADCIYAFTNILSDTHQNRARVNQIVNYVRNF